MRDTAPPAHLHLISMVSSRLSSRACMALQEGIPRCQAWRMQVGVPPWQGTRDGDFESGGQSVPPAMLGSACGADRRPLLSCKPWG